MSRKFATRHRCANRVTVHCVKGAGKGPRKCGACGSHIWTERGVYGVFTWRGDGQYRPEDAHAVRLTERAANAYASRDGSYVVRWIFNGRA